MVSYNTELLKSTDLTSYGEILNSKWKGKIGSMDPRASDFYDSTILKNCGSCEKYLLSKDSGVLDRGFGDEREIVPEPSVDPAFERANSGDSFGSQ